ncbi:MAG TPA: EamA family transporter [Candidatus Limnocylindria bacterium]|nr:EamA family transporter [Candidatus Limnocylindria bacterium]
MIGPGVVEGIAAAVSFGSGDFLGGIGAKRAGGMIVAAGSQLVGAVALVLFLLIDGSPAPPISSLAIAAGAGMFGVVGVAALYRGLTLGSMGLVAAVSALGSVVLPLLVTVFVYRLAIGELQVVGVACAAAAGAAASGAARDAASRSALLLALGAALAFGMWYVLLDLAAGDGELWALTTSRVTATVFMSGLALAVVRRGVADRVRRAWPLMVFAGLFDVGGNVLFVLASSQIEVGLAAALSGIYPLVTMLLAWAILREKLPPLGLLGVGLALTGIILISIGG